MTDSTDREVLAGAAAARWREIRAAESSGDEKPQPSEAKAPGASGARAPSVSRERMRMTRELHDIKDYPSVVAYAQKIPSAPSPCDR